MDYKGKKILVIIPAYNEAENIVQVVEQMRSVAPWCDYLVVNDGSTDKTPAICEGQGFRYLDLSINMGIGGAVQAGYIYAYKNDYDIAVQMDGDGQHDAAYLENLLEPILAEEADVVIPWTIPSRRPLWRRLCILAGCGRFRCRCGPEREA